ncbi:MAG: tetratricopeptide repeat protein [Deltaproteobacteria bacterium]|nr:tetratricopeptide repeat protein [Deltaproteobacteria bacterium]
MLEGGRTEEAVAVLRTALGATPNHLALVDAAAQAYISGGRLADSEQVTSAALAVFDDEGWAHGSHARVLLAKGEPAKAVGELDRAVELSPGDASLYALRGDAAREVGSTEEAKTSYEKALQLDPGQARALSGFVALLIDLGDFARAAELRYATCGRTSSVCASSYGPARGRAGSPRCEMPSGGTRATQRCDSRARACTSKLKTTRAPAAIFCSPDAMEQTRGLPKRPSPLRRSTAVESWARSTRSSAQSKPRTPRAVL